MKHARMHACMQRQTGAELGEVTTERGWVYYDNIGFYPDKRIVPIILIDSEDYRHRMQNE